MNAKMHHFAYGLFHNDANQPAGIKTSHPFLYLLPLLPLPPLFSGLVSERERQTLPSSGPEVSLELIYWNSGFNLRWDPGGIAAVVK